MCIYVNSALSRVEGEGERKDKHKLPSCRTHSRLTPAMHASCSYPMHSTLGSGTTHRPTCCSGFCSGRWGTAGQSSSCATRKARQGTPGRLWLCCRQPPRSSSVQPMAAARTHRHRLRRTGPLGWGVGWTVLSRCRGARRRPCWECWWEGSYLLVVKW